MNELSIGTTCACGGKLHGRPHKYITADGPVMVAACKHCGLSRDLIRHSDESFYRNEDGVYKAPSDEEFALKVASLEGLVNFIGSHFSSVGTAIEVGCNAGQLLAALRKSGWHTLGVEANKACADFANRKGLRVINATLETAAVDKETFDLAVFSHVLEHIPDPLAVLAMTRDLLRTGGQLYIAVPNYSSPANTRLRSGWANIFIPGQHLWHFTKRTLAEMCESVGFEVITLKTRIYMEPKSNRPLGNVIKRAAILGMRAFDAGEEVVGVFRK